MGRPGDRAVTAYLSVGQRAEPDAGAGAPVGQLWVKISGDGDREVLRRRHRWTGAMVRDMVHRGDGGEPHRVRCNSMYRKLLIGFGV